VTHAISVVFVSLRPAIKGVQLGNVPPTEIFKNIFGC